MLSPGAAARDGNGSAPDPRAHDRKFPRECRLTARSQYKKVYGDGRRVRSRWVTLFGIPNDQGITRVGITVTKKIGGAVLRNRVKRRFREIFRNHRHELLPAMDLVVNAHRGIDGAGYIELEKEFVEQAHALMRRLAR